MSMSVASSESFVNKQTTKADIHLRPIEEEDERLRELGIRRELRKEFTSFSTISFALGILGKVLQLIIVLFRLTFSITDVLLV